MDDDRLRVLRERQVSQHAVIPLLSLEQIDTFIDDEVKYLLRGCEWKLSVFLTY